MNQVQTVLPHYRAGKVRLLGVTTLAPVAAVKEVPTVAASGLPQPVQVLGIGRAGVYADVAGAGVAHQIAVGSGARHKTGVGCG
jgi:tripartite-type tricarboxylate transporter receptor subunit TctC